MRGCSTTRTPPAPSHCHSPRSRPLKGVRRQARCRPIERSSCTVREWTSAQAPGRRDKSEEHTSELQSPYDLVCRLLLEKKKTTEHAAWSTNNSTHDTH